MANLLQKSLSQHTKSNRWSEITPDECDARAIYFIDFNDDQTPRNSFTYEFTNSLIVKIYDRSNIIPFRGNIDRHHTGYLKFRINQETKKRSDVHAFMRHSCSCSHTWSHDAGFRLTIFLLLTVFLLFFFMLAFSLLSAHTCIRINAVYVRRTCLSFHFLNIFFSHVHCRTCDDSRRVDDCHC